MSKDEGVVMKIITAHGVKKIRLLSNGLLAVKPIIKPEHR